jgi:hypothetical protein
MPKRPSAIRTFGGTVFWPRGMSLSTEENMKRIFRLFVITAIIISLPYFMVQESIKHFPIPLQKSLKVIAEGDFLDSFVYAQSAPANNKDNTADYLFASALKTAVKAYIALEDKNKLLQRINNINEEEFNIKYQKALRDFPLLSFRYGFKDKMSKEQVIRKLRSWDKNTVCGIIDSLPNAAVVRVAKRRVAFGESLAKNNNDFLKAAGDLFKMTIQEL